jgi:hypothetical protein
LIDQLLDLAHEAVLLPTRYRASAHSVKAAILEQVPVRTQRTNVTTVSRGGLTMRSTSSANFSNASRFSGR